MPSTPSLNKDIKMVTVGNIITKESITGIPNNFGTYETVTTTDIPNLIIGWDLTKKLFPETSILKKKIKDNVYWTFSTTEKRTIFEEYLKCPVNLFRIPFLHQILIFQQRPRHNNQ
jgi:hypothetical protein